MVDLPRALRIVAIDVDHGDLVGLRKGNQDSPFAGDSLQVDGAQVVDPGSGEPIVARLTASAGEVSFDRLKGGPDIRSKIVEGFFGDGSAPDGVGQEVFLWT